MVWNFIGLIYNLIALEFLYNRLILGDIYPFVSLFIDSLLTGVVVGVALMCAFEVAHSAVHHTLYAIALYNI